MIPASATIRRGDDRGMIGRGWWQTEAGGILTMPLLSATRQSNFFIGLVGYYGTRVGPQIAYLFAVGDNGVAKVAIVSSTAA